MIPIGDDNPCPRTPYVTAFLISFMAMIFAYEFWLDAHEKIDGFIRGFGLIPQQAVRPTPGYITYIFLHAGWEHILPNLLFLWIFGDNVEAALGRLRFFLFFLVMGAISGFIHMRLLDFSGDAALIGASGSISAVLGAYFTLFRNTRIRVCFPTVLLAPPLVLFGAPFLWFFYMPSALFIALWFAGDFYQAAFVGDIHGTVAFWTHISGFAGGLAIGFLARGERKAHMRRAHQSAAPDFKALVRRNFR